MKRSFFFLGLAAVLFGACTSENKNKTAADSSELIAEDTTFTATKAPSSAVRAECYRYINNRDTVAMELKIAGEEYTGKLNYSFFEKDKNKGTFAGEMKGDTLIAEYIFDSEGMRSVREVVFLKKDEKLLEGFGETEEKGSKVIFKDRSKLNFGNAVVLSKTACD